MHPQAAYTSSRECRGVDLACDGVTRPSLTALHPQSCILCTGVDDILSTSATLNRPTNVPAKASDGDRAPGARPAPPPYGLGAVSSTGNDFVLGDDDEDSSADEDTTRDRAAVRPRAPESLGRRGEVDCRGEPPDYHDGAGVGAPGLEELHRKEKDRPQPHIHYLRPEDTLLGLSMHYGIDVSTIPVLSQSDSLQDRLTPAIPFRQLM